MQWRETAMFILLLGLSLLGTSNGEYGVRCGDGEELSFVEAADGVRGRYHLEWCTVVDGAMGQASQWGVSLRYSTKRQRKDCLHYKPEFSRWKEHSYFLEDIRLEQNCTNVCFSTTLDLIFNGTCYTFKTHLRIEPSSKVIRRIAEKDYVRYVNNNYTKDNFANSQAVVKMYPSGDHVVAHWYLHNVPATNYTMELCRAASSDTSRECTDVTRNCSTVAPSRTEVSCLLWPPAAPYSLLLKHCAPWVSGNSLFERISSVELNSTTYIVESEPPAVALPASAAPWWALGGVLAAAAGGGAALLACRSLAARRLHERLRARWQQEAERRAASGAGGAGGGGGRRVLLLYARDCAPLLAVAAALRALLERTADHVYDLYSPETVSLSARAPAEWLRRLLAARDVRVVLLQSRAAACLHAAAEADRGATHLQLERPLLNRRVLYRAPHASDCLLPLALRLLADTAHTTHSYKKYYVANIYGLEAELVRSVTPLRRYSLPGAAGLLLRDLTDGAPPADLPLAADLQRLDKAVQDLHDHVRANPDYLDEELIFFDYD